MLQFLLTVIFITLVKPVPSLAQEQTYRAPIYEQIEAIVLDPESVYYYPKILQRFFAKDTTLSVDDFHYLYYGFVYQKTYENPWEIENNLLVNLKTIQAAGLNESNYDKYIQLSEESLRECPINPFALNMLAYLYSLKNDEITSRSWIYLSAGITKAMISSGDGKSCETGYHIVLNSHINYFMTLLDVPQTPEPKFDEQYRCAEINFGGQMSLYFNVEKRSKAGWDYIFRERKNSRD